jgi:hypothetical protein
VTTGHIRCGTFANICSSTIFGSTRIILTSCGERVSRRLARIVLMHTDLPEPVVPAIRRCGIFARSSMIGVPSASMPRNKGSDITFGS